MSIIAININAPGKIIAAYMQSTDDPDVWTWFDECGNESFTDEQKVTLRRIVATGDALSMRCNGGHCYKWFDGTTFSYIRVSAVFHFNTGHPMR